MHEWVLEIRADDRGVARKEFGIEATGQRETRRWPSEQAGAADSSARNIFRGDECCAGSDDTRDVRISLARVVGNHQPTHAVPHDEEWETLSFGSHGCNEALQIVYQVFEASHVTADSAGFPVALLVVRVNRRAGARQLGSHVFVAPAVFRVTVNQDDDAFRGLRQPGSPKQQVAGRSSDVRFRASDSVRFQTGIALGNAAWIHQSVQDLDAPRIAARASLTRWR